MRSLSTLLLFASLASADVQVFVFVRTDCPITNRYAPELTRIAKEFQGRHVAFYLVYPDPNENKRAIENHMAEFGFPGTPMRDPDHTLQNRAHATVAPEAAVFDATGNLKYHGRIDDRFISPGIARTAQVHDLEDAISAVLAGKPIAHPETEAIGCSLKDVRAGVEAESGRGKVEPAKRGSTQFLGSVLASTGRIYRKRSGSSILRLALWPIIQTLV